MRKHLAPLLLVSSLLAGLSSCDSESIGSATPQASDELNEIIHHELTALDPNDLSEEEREDLQQVQSLIKSFHETHNVNAAAPKTKITLLHLAAGYKKEELVRCLLLDGADPNAQRLYRNNDGALVPGDTPLTYAAADMATDSQQEQDPQRILRIIKMLIDKGADMSKRGIHDALPVEIAGLTSGREQLVLELLKLTPKEAIAPPIAGQNKGLLLHIAAHYSYPNLMTELLKLGYDANTRLYSEQIPLLTLVCSGRGSVTDKLATMDVLLKHGADINLGDAQKRTPLFTLAFTARSQTPDTNQETQVVDQIIALLQRGARVDISSGQDEEYPGFSPYDLLSLRPQLLEELAKKGHPLKAPPLTLPEDDTALLATLCRMTLTNADYSQLDEAALQRIASILLSPSDAMLHHELYEPGLKSALSILHRLDATKTRDILNSLPIWNSDAAQQGHAAPHTTHLGCTTCSSCGHESHILRPILESITSQQGWIIPSDKILHLANTLVAAEQHALAITCLELLARCPDHEVVIEQLLTSPDATLRTGALHARLLAHDLPLPVDDAVQDWLSKHERVAQTPFMKKALLLTSLNELWFGSMPEDEIATLLTVLEEIGAPQAAKQYRRIIPMLKNPEKLDEIMSGDQSWQQQLDETIAHYFYEHRKEFAPNLE